jgi:hypothetical protein
LVLISVCFILPAVIKLLKIEQGTGVVSQPAESRSRIRRAEGGYSLNCHFPVRSRDALGIESYSIFAKKQALIIFRLNQLTIKFIFNHRFDGIRLITKTRGD